MSLEAAVGYLHSPTPLFFLSIFGFLVAWEWELDVGPAFFFLFLNDDWPDGRLYPAQHTREKEREEKMVLGSMKGLSS